MSAREKPNYFVLLKLDFNAPWNEQDFQHALSQARGQWARDASGLQSQPKTGDAKQYLSYTRTSSRS